MQFVESKDTNKSLYFYLNRIFTISLDETIKVYVRIRPFLEEETKKQMKTCIENLDQNKKFMTSKKRFNLKN